MLAHWKGRFVEQAETRTLFPASSRTGFMTAPYARSPLDKFPEYTQAIGLIIVEMGVLEASCVHLLASLLRTTETVANSLLMTPQSTRARLDIIKSVSTKLLPVDSAREVSDTISKCEKALNKRNSIVHGIWGAREKTVFLIPIPDGSQGQ